jgi:hypothetical protein
MTAWPELALVAAFAIIWLACDVLKWRGKRRDFFSPERKRESGGEGSASIGIPREHGVR